MINACRNGYSGFRAPHDPSQAEIGETYSAGGVLQGANGVSVISSHLGRYNKADEPVNRYRNSILSLHSALVAKDRNEKGNRLSYIDQEGRAVVPTLEY